jgi:hypothetical protein
MNQIGRLFAAIALLVGIELGYSKIASMGLPIAVVFREADFVDMPLQLGPWTGEASQPDPRVVIATGAEAVVDRVYQHPSGYGVSCHVAAFTDPSQYTPHPPTLCYSGAGWKLVNTKGVPIATDADPSGRAQMLSFEREGQTAHVLFWYQLGDGIGTDRDGVRRLRWSFRGKPAWPPLIKVMLQTTIEDRDQAEARLKELAGPVLAWTQSISRAETP